MVSANTVWGGKRRRKLGEVVAERIIAEIVRRGWNEGEVLGTEADFMQRFRVSRATFREAVRQLEWQGAAGMRRGASGGLVVKSLPRQSIVFSLKTYFELTQVSSAELKRADAILRHAPRLRPQSQDNQAISLFLEAADGRTVLELAQSRKASATAKLSEVVALRLVEDIEKAGALAGTNLGNEVDLQRRYQVSRAVLREALRPLELHDIVRVKTGAHGGIIIHRCDPDYTVELTTTYLTYARIPLSHLWEAQSALETAAIEGFVAAVDEAGIRDLRKALVRLDHSSASHYIAAASEFHRVIADRCGNRAVSLFVEVLQRYGGSTLPDPGQAFLPPIKDQHHAFLDLVERRDAAGAAVMMRKMFEHSRRWIVRIERDLDRQMAGRLA